MVFFVPLYQKKFAIPTQVPTPLPTILPSGKWGLAVVSVV
jgi:hypothetical protein